MYQWEQDIIQLMTIYNDIVKLIIRLPMRLVNMNMEIDNGKKVNNHLIEMINSQRTGVNLK